MLAMQQHVLDQLNQGVILEIVILGCFPSATSLLSPSLHFGETIQQENVLDRFALCFLLICASFY
jgi:hypothetical protein